MLCFKQTAVGRQRFAGGAVSPFLAKQCGQGHNPTDLPLPPEMISTKADNVKDKKLQ